MTPTAFIPVHEASQVGHARRTLAAMTARLGFSNELAGRAALIATELGTNLAAHAREGELVLRALDAGDRLGVEILAFDKGPGMEDVGACMRDGFSTGSTPGKGLGAIRRMAHAFDVHSLQGKGTAIMAQVWANPDPRPPPAIEFCALAAPHPGEQAVGDGWACAVDEAGVWRFLVVDGLGHGMPAATASRAAEEQFDAHPFWEPAEQMRALDKALRSTRGAAAAVAEVDPGRARIRYAGVGNIAATSIVGERVHRLVSLNGTLGHVVARVQEFQYGWGPGAILVMHSDGVSQNFKLDTYPGLLRRHASVIAATVYRDFARGRDDATVLVARDLREEVS